MQKYKTLQNFLDSLEPEQKEIIETLRKLILETKQNLWENIKWNAPNYEYNWLDRITFNVLNKEHIVKLILHFWASIKENKKGSPVYDKHSDFIYWSSDIRGYMSFENKEKVLKNSEKIKEILKDWLEINIK